MSETPDKLEYLSRMITSSLKRRRQGQKWWSLATHGATVLVVTFSAISAVLSQSKGNLYNIPVLDVATILSLAVTVISTVQSKLGFERKWIANRMTQSALSQLDIDRNMGMDPDKLADALKAIMAKHDQAITTT